MSISYSDGSEIEQKILQLLQQAPELGSGIHVGREHHAAWPIQYHLCRERANLLRHLSFAGLDILELGAGMGGVSQFLAEQAQTLHVVEGAQARYDALTARLHGLDNWTGTLANIEGFQIDRRFDVVCVIGVLEYAEVFFSSPAGTTDSAFALFLQKAASFLKPDGVLLLAIENRLGLKYWSGAPEDHTGNMFDGIVGYSPRRTPKTFSRAELRGLLDASGFVTIEEQFPFPDYKIPCCVLTSEFAQRWPVLASDLASSAPYAAYASGRAENFPDLLAMDSVTHSGLLPEFANSFLMLASPMPNSPILGRLLERQVKMGEVAWHYSAQRKVPAQTRFKKSPGDTLTVAKTLMHAEREDHLSYADGDLRVEWRALLEPAVVAGTPLRTRLARHAYFGEWDDMLEELLQFLRWSLDRWHIPSSSTIQVETMLSGEALDAIGINCMHAPGDGYRLFDLEWIADAPIAASWFVFRNVMALGCIASFFSSTGPFRSMKDLYILLCDRLSIPANFERDCERETRLQGLVNLPSVNATTQATLRDMFEHPFTELPYPRNPTVEHSEFAQREIRTAATRKLEQELASLRTDHIRLLFAHEQQNLGHREELEQCQNFLPHRFGRKLNDLFKTIPAFHWFLRKLLLGRKHE